MAAKKNMRTKKTTEKLTASKKIIIASYAIGAVLTGVTIVGAFLGFDVSTVGMVTTVAYAEIAASNAFYYNKAKKENALKIALSAVEKYSTDKVEDITKIVNSLGGII